MYLFKFTTIFIEINPFSLTKHKVNILTSFLKLDVDFFDHQLFNLEF